MQLNKPEVADKPHSGKPHKAEGSAATQAAVVAATAAIDKATASANEMSDPIAQSAAGNWQDCKRQADRSGCQEYYIYC